MYTVLYKLAGLMTSDAPSSFGFDARCRDDIRVRFAVTVQGLESRLHRRGCAIIAVIPQAGEADERSHTKNPGQIAPESLQHQARASAKTSVHRC